MKTIRWFFAFLIYYSTKSLLIALNLLVKSFSSIAFLLISWIGFNGVVGKIRKLKKSERCYVIMTGPSLTDSQLEKIGDDDVITASGFWQHHLAKKLNIVAYAFYDKNYFDETQKSYNFFDSLFLNCKPLSIVGPAHIVGANYFAYLQKYRLPILATWHHGLGDKNIFSYGLWPKFAGVSAYCLMLSVLAGYKEIHLLGFDHDYLVNRSFDKHFYDGATIPGTTEKPLSELVTYQKEMSNNYRLWENYYKIRSMAERRDIKIYNRTPGSYLDVFEFED
jgi:hypothetical protein